MQIDGGQSALSAGGMAPPDTTLNAVLAHPFCFALFQDHLHAAKQADSLVCWAVMRRFSLLTGPTIRAAVAASVYDNFIRAGAPFEINISHSLVRYAMHSHVHTSTRPHALLRCGLRRSVH
jgi:hypothetical protein